MMQLPTKLKLSAKDAEALEYKDGGEGVMMAEWQSTPYEPSRYSKAVQDAVAEIEKIRGKRALFIQVNRLDPGVIIATHTDTLKVPYPLERWHLPIQTNKEAWHEDASGKFNMCEGVWYGPVPYWLPHSGGNKGTTPRIHLIVDLETDGQPVILEAPTPPLKAAQPPAAGGGGSGPQGFDGAKQPTDLAVANKLEMASTGS